MLRGFRFEFDDMSVSTQNKQKEIAFFDGHAGADDYDVFTPQASARIVDAFIRLTGLKPPARVVDLGCGSGTFTALLARAATPRSDRRGRKDNARRRQSRRV